MNNFIDQIKNLFDELPEKQKSKLKITISNKYTETNKYISYNGTPPKIKVYNMDKNFTKFEGVYENLDKLQEFMQNHNEKSKSRVFKSSNGEIRVGHGRVKTIGKYKTI